MTHKVSINVTTILSVLSVKRRVSWIVRAVVILIPVMSALHVHAINWLYGL